MLGGGSRAGLAGPAVQPAAPARACRPPSRPPEPEPGSGVLMAGPGARVTSSAARRGARIVGICLSGAAVCRSARFGGAVVRRARPFRTCRGVRFTRSQIYLICHVSAILTILSVQVWTLANARKNRVKSPLLYYSRKKNLCMAQMYRQISILLIRYGLEDGK